MFGGKRLLVIVGGAVAGGLVLVLFLRAWLLAPAFPEDAARGTSLEEAGDAVEVVAENLEAPWEIAFLPGGDLLITERPGRLLRLAPDGRRRSTVEIAGVSARGEAGLLGLALHPRFDETRWVFVYLTSDEENRIERYVLDTAGELTDRRVLVDGIPAAAFHDGGRLAFGPDGLLYATTGDAGDRSAAQDPASLAGKVLRMTESGGVPESNPEGGRALTLGHRNPQGLAWDAQGRLWVTEHGPSGVSSGYDEINLVEPGANYGWPVVTGDEEGAGFEPPVLHSGEQTWAPSGGTWLGGRFFFGGLRGEALYEMTGSQTGTPRLVVHFFGALGRIRQVSRGPDGMLYVLTNNRDGRGRPRAGDDRVLRIDPAVLAGH